MKCPSCCPCCQADSLERERDQLKEKATQLDEQNKRLRILCELEEIKKLREQNAMLVEALEKICKPEQYGSDAHVSTCRLIIAQEALEKLKGKACP